MHTNEQTFIVSYHIVEVEESQSVDIVLLD